MNGCKALNKGYQSNLWLLHSLLHDVDVQGEEHARDEASLHARQLLHQGVNLLSHLLPMLLLKNMTSNIEHRSTDTHAEEGDCCHCHNYEVVIVNPWEREAQQSSASPSHRAALSSAASLLT